MLPPGDLTTPGWQQVGDEPAQLHRETLRLLRTATRVLGTCVREAPEFAARKRRRARR